VEVLELDPGIRGREAPVDPTTGLQAGVRLDLVSPPADDGRLRRRGVIADRYAALVLITPVRIVGVNGLPALFGEISGAQHPAVDRARRSRQFGHDRGGDHVDTAGQCGVNGVDRGWDGAVLLDHHVDLASVLGVGLVGTQNRPEIVVLRGVVVVVERVAECGPSRPDRSGHAAEAFDLGRDGFEPCQVATGAWGSVSRSNLPSRRLPTIQALAHLRACR